MNVNTRVTKVFRNRYFVGIMVVVIVAIVLVVTTYISKAEQQTSITYRAHVAYNGWLSWKKDGEVAGTVGESRRMEAIKIKLTGNYTGDVIYQTYVRDMGWQEWVSNSAIAGSESSRLRVEAIEVKLVEKKKQVQDNSQTQVEQNMGQQEVNDTNIHKICYSVIVIVTSFLPKKLKSL